MSESRPYEASARKQRQALARGDVARSAEIVSAAVLGAVLLCFVGFGQDVVSASRALLSEALVSVRSGEGVQRLLASPALRALAVSTASGLLAIALAGLLASFVQTGFSVRAPGAERSSLEGRRAFAWVSLDAALQHLLDLVKAAVVIAAVGYALSPSLGGLVDAVFHGPGELLALWAKVARESLQRATVALLSVGLLDLAYQHLRRRLRLRMSRRELDEEERMLFGSSALRAERTRRARSAIEAATLAELDRAVLVLHDDDARAVALAYDPERDRAPKLWIKAQGDVSSRLVERANQLGLPVQREPALVSELLRLEATEPVPARTYEALAQCMHRAGRPAARAQTEGSS